MLAFLDSLKATLMTEKLHWLPLSARIQFKIIFQDYKAFLGLAPSYRCKLIMRPLSTISDRPLRSLDRNDLLAPQARTSTSQQRAFASAGPLLWNCLPVKTRALILSGSFSSTPRVAPYRNVNRIELKNVRGFIYENLFKCEPYKELFALYHKKFRKRSSEKEVQLGRLGNALTNHRLYIMGKHARYPTGFCDLCQVKENIEHIQARKPRGGWGDGPP